MRFGIIGGGMIAHHHAKAIQDMHNGTLEAIYARRPEAAKELAHLYNCKAYSDLDKLLSDTNIDIVTIATPSGKHMEPTIAAANAGKHIICEKPLEINPQRIQKMIDAADNNNVVLSGIFNRRFNPAVGALKQAVDKNRFGQLTLCDAQIKWYRDQEYYDSGEWRGTWELDGGGALMNQSIHTIDLLLYFAGPVKQLSASVATLTHEGIEVEDNAVVMLEFENGALGTIQASTSCWSSCGLPAQIQICGDQGSAFLVDDKFSHWDFKNPSPEDDNIQSMMVNGIGGIGANDPNAIDHIGHIRNFEDVVDAINQNRPPSISSREAAKAVELICAIYQSANNNGQWVQVNK